eukprot:m.155453 g.155453  ORF g.155453 m.155453 type:complete len:147 (-) comp30937_c0_seq2:336-776(-)
MVVVEIRHVDVNGSTEQILIELQGTIEFGNIHSAVPGLKLGTIQYDGKDAPQLYIGHHMLKGKVEKLKAPFALLRKHKITETDILEEGQTPPPPPQSPNVHYTIDGIIRRKFIFTTRPTSILTDAQRGQTTMSIQDRRRQDNQGNV